MTRKQWLYPLLIIKNSATGTNFRPFHRTSGIR
jgi:hypothetical protein